MSSLAACWPVVGCFDWSFWKIWRFRPSRVYLRSRPSKFVLSEKILRQCACSWEWVWKRESGCVRIHSESACLCASGRGCGYCAYRMVVSLIHVWPSWAKKFLLLCESVSELLMRISMRRWHQRNSPFVRTSATRVRGGERSLISGHCITVAVGECVWHYVRDIVTLPRKCPRRHGQVVKAVTCG